MSVSMEWAAAIAETEAIIAADPARAEDRTLPIFILAARERIAEERKNFDGGEKMALLAAIRDCACYDLPMPEWVSRAFIRAYDQVLSCRSDSWDEVFGRPYKKGAHLSRMRQARINRGAVWLEVKRAVQRGESINTDLFERIGARIGIGKTRAEELYAQAKRRLGNPAKK